MGRPKLLMLDEPSLGLAPIVLQKISSSSPRSTRRRRRILLVEQNANQALLLADRGYVLETGLIVLEDAADSLLGNDEVRKAYLGQQ
jgi:branched-chain amino acid transport system ATP-binding protein